MKKTAYTIIFAILLPLAGLSARNGADTLITRGPDDLFSGALDMENITFSDGAFRLTDGSVFGTVTFRADTADIPFDQALPSWNGHAWNDQSMFKVLMRFYSGGAWSPWVTVGFWKTNIWGNYGTLVWPNGEVDVDYVKLNIYHSVYQFQVQMGRVFSSSQSPEISTLSVFLSDSRTTESADISGIYTDRPPAILIPTEHFYQYDLDDAIGGDICSPTSVSMVLRSYGIPVDPVDFARATRDPYWGLFGVWPRVVQNAHEYGLAGAVTRYRTWSEAYDVLAAGGRIAMSLGPPLYTGHLVMLAGFDASGNPLVHDPAVRSGYAYRHDKYSLTRSWFEKGGISYTFTLEDSSRVITGIESASQVQPSDVQVLHNYPNPFNSTTIIPLSLTKSENVHLRVIDVQGHTLHRRDMVLESGRNMIRLHAAMSGISAAGTYFILIEYGETRITVPVQYLK